MDNKTRGKVARTLAFTAWIGMVLPATTTTADEQQKSFPVVDISLTEHGSFRGSVVNADGQRLDGVSLQLRSMRDSKTSSVVTNKGEFSFQKIAGGSYQLSTPHSNYFCRIWTKQAAPPAAVDKLLVVSDDRLARAQRPMSQFFMADPFWISVAVAAAVVIPIAVHNSGGDRVAGS